MERTTGRAALPAFNDFAGMPVDLGGEKGAQEAAVRVPQHSEHD